MRLIELSLIQIPSIIWSPITWVLKSMWKLKLSSRRDFGLGCLCYGGNTWAAPQLLETGIRQSQKFSHQFLWEMSVPFQSKHSTWNNLGFLCMIFPRVWILWNLRGLRSVLVKTGLSIHTQTVIWWERQCHQAPEEFHCYPPDSLRLAHVSSEVGFSKLDTVLCLWVQWKDYVTFLADKHLEILVQVQLFTQWHGKVLSFWLTPRAIFAVNHL